MHSSARLERMHGHLTLDFTLKQQRTRLTVREHRPPLQVVRDFGLADGTSFVHLHNVAGGVLAGDQLTTTINLAASTKAQLTTTSSTRIYRSAGEQVAYQSLQANLAEQSLLEYWPDTTIPFAESVYQQQTRIDLAADAGLCWWEFLAPGREAYGERFAYRQLRLDCDIYALGRPLLLDRMRLQPSLQQLNNPLYFGNYSYLATGYICRVGWDAALWKALEAELMAVAASQTKLGRCLWGVSCLAAHGLVIRGLSTNSRDLLATAFDYWRFAKQALYGTSPNLPRKIY